MRDRRRLEKHVLFELDEDEIIDDINFGEVNAKYYPNLRGYYSHEIKGNWFDSGIWTYFKDSVRHIVITFMIILNHGFLNTSVQEKSNVNLSLYKYTFPVRYLADHKHEMWIRNVTIEKQTETVKSKEKIDGK